MSAKAHIFTVRDIFVDLWHIHCYFIPYGSFFWSATIEKHNNPVTDIRTLGRTIRTHRKAKGLTLQQAAGLANVSVRFLSELERGKETAEVGKVVKTLRAMGLDLSINARRSHQQGT